MESPFLAHKLSLRPTFRKCAPNCVIAGAAGQCAGWACGASRRRAPTPVRRRQNALHQLCRTMPAYPAPAFLWRNCVCVRMLLRCEIEGAVSPNSAVDSISFFSCSQTKPKSPSLTRRERQSLHAYIQTTAPKLGREAQPALGLLNDEFSVVHTRPCPRAAPRAKRCRRRCRGARSHPAWSPRCPC